jgi:CheY-like chemotaxis protein
MTVTVANPTSPAPDRLKVLLANEQEAWHRQVRDLLAPQGVSTLSALTGREALDLIERGTQDATCRVHVAVLDDAMSGLGGLQVAKIAGGLPGSPPLILMTDRPTGHVLQQALMLRVFSVLPKPIELNHLLDSLARVVRRHYGNRWPGGSQ